MWYKVFADGSELDIVYANNQKEAIEIAEKRHGAAVWTCRAY
jgi:hypothetical protein